MRQTSSLEQQVIGTLRKITRAIDLHSRQLLKQCGLTSPQLAALQAIDRRQPISVGALAQEIHLGQATVTGILRRLEDRGLVLRNRRDDDRRSVMMTLTDAGTEVLRNSRSGLQERLQRELAQLHAWEQTQILATLQRIAAMMGADDLVAGPVLGAQVGAQAPEDLSEYHGKPIDQVNGALFVEVSLPAQPTPPVNKTSVPGQNSAAAADKNVAVDDDRLSLE